MRIHDTSNQAAKTYALDRAAAWIGKCVITELLIIILIDEWNANT
jgi:hypothetical protein